VLLVVHQFLQLEGYSSAAEALVRDIPDAATDQDRCAAIPTETAYVTAVHPSGKDRGRGLHF